MSIDVVTVAGRRDLMRFIDFPHDLYRDDDCYVPQLVLQQKVLLGRRHNPFLLHSEMELFLARCSGQVVGRIAAIHNRLYNTHHRSRMGFFGFFDCEDDAEVAEALLRAVEAWHGERGHDRLRGPVNPDMNNSCGLLIDGFSRPPSIFMPYNAPYYRRLVEAAGLRICKKLNAWEIASERIPKTVFRHTARIRQRLSERGYVLRILDKKRFDAEMGQLRKVYNDAMSESWGFSPLTVAEFEEQAEGLKRICPPDLIQVAEHEGRIVGFIGAAPDMNETLRRIPRGRLLPFGWAILLAGRRNIAWTRIVMYGVHRAHRHTGLGSWLYLATIQAVRDRGFEGAEASYVLEDNHPVNRLSERLGGICCKRYALFEKVIGREPAGPGPGDGIDDVAMD